MRMSVVREKVQMYGMYALSNEELLALILCADDPTARVTMLRQVQKLFAQCGDVQRIMCTEVGELCLEHGLSEAKAAQMQAVLEFAKRLTQPPAKNYRIRSVNDAVALVRMQMMYLDHEEFRVLILDAGNQVIANLCLYQGTVNGIFTRTAEIVRPAVIRKAPRIIVCHNHPSGDASPSLEDIALTKQLAQAGRFLDIEVLDHLIIGNPSWVSLKEHQYLPGEQP